VRPPRDAPRGGEGGSMIDPAWKGPTAFYELVFGTWLAYLLLVLMWERWLRQPLEEWRYVLIVFLGASFFWVNHYFFGAPFYLWMINLYALVFWGLYYVIAVRPHARTFLWRVSAMFTAVAFTIGYILFENVARFGVRAGCNEFWFMFAALFGFVYVIVSRGRRSAVHELLPSR
jgi:hypothetical protein